MSAIKFGLLLPHFTQHGSRRSILEGAKIAEQVGFHSVWVRDHLFISPGHREHGGITDPGFFTEATLTLAAVSGVAPSLHLGTAVLTPHRHPVKVAQLFATLSYLSGDRVILGIGGGSDPHEFEAAGVPFDSRFQVVRETVEICRRLWANDTASYRGQQFSFRDVSINPRPASGHIPIWYGGVTYGSADLAVEFADGWLPSRIPFDRLAQRIAYLRGQRATAGKTGPFDIAAMPQTAIGRTREDALRDFHLDKVKAEALKRKAIAGGRTDLSLQDLEGFLIWGDATDLCRYVERFAALGVGHVIFDMRSSFPKFEANVAAIGNAVIPRFR